MSGPRKQVIEIATKAEGEVVEISLQEISNENREDVSAIRDALLQEDVPLKEKPGYFLEFAVGCSRCRGFLGNATERVLHA
jgi:hypothetical protein